MQNVKTMFNTIKNFFKMKNLNYQKEMYRGTVKQIMKVRGLRTISLANYNKWNGISGIGNGIHSLKLNLQDGYVNIYGYSNTVDKNGRYLCGDMIADASPETYKAAYDSVMEIINNEKKIPSKYKKNILVGLNR